jgi:hypothetical protein
VRRHFKPLMRVILIIAGPFLLLSAIYTSIAQVHMFDISLRSDYLSTVFFNSIISNVFVLLAMVLLIAVVHAYVKADAENKENDEELKTDKILQLVKQNVWKSLGLVFLYILFFAVTGGIYALIFYAGGPVVFSFLIILGVFFFIYLAFRLSYVFAAGLLDDYSVTDSFIRSWNLSTGYFWTNLGIAFIFGMLVGMISTFTALPSMILSMIVATHGGNMDINPIWKLLGIIIQTIGSLIAQAGYALPLIAYILQYYSAVEKTEGIGLLEKIEKMEIKTEEDSWGEESF